MAMDAFTEVGLLAQRARYWREICEAEEPHFIEYLNYITNGKSFLYDTLINAGPPCPENNFTLTVHYQEMLNFINEHFGNLLSAWTNLEIILQSTIIMKRVIEELMEHLKQIDPDDYNSMIDNLANQVVIYMELEQNFICRL